MDQFRIWTIFILLALSKVTSEKFSKTKIDENLLGTSVFYGLTVTATVEPTTSICREELSKIADGIVDRQRWAIKMLDASGMPEGGLYWGNTYWLGSRTQCEATSVIKNLTSVSLTIGPITEETIEDIPPFPTAYFAAYFFHNSSIQLITHIENEFRMTWSACLPRSCDGPELKTLLQKYFDSKKLHHQSLYSTTFQMEEVKKLIDDYSWLSHPFTIILTILTVFFIALCIFGTIFDVKYYRPMMKSLQKRNIIKNVCENYKENVGQDKDQNYNPVVEKHHAKSLNLNLGSRMLLCFSVYRNHKEIFNMETDPSEMSSLHGLRTIFTTYIICGHSLWFMQDVFSNRSFGYFIDDELRFQILYESIFAVDSFYCMSGFLAAFTFFTHEYSSDPNKKYNIQNRGFLFLSGVIKRFLRLTPSFLFVTLLSPVVTNWRYRETPFWSNERTDWICPNYWWRNILYIQTLLPRNEMCLSWGWYLGNDMQFMILIQLFLVLSTMHFKTAAKLLTIFFFACIGYVAFLVFKLEYIPHMDVVYAFRETFYDKPYARIGPFIVGVYAAYFMYYYKKSLPFKRPVVWIMWIFSISFIMYIMCSLMDRNFSLTYSAIYTSLARSLWGVAIAWMIIACETGNGGIADKILSCKCFYPISRITFMAYLTNPIVTFFIWSFGDKAFVGSDAVLVYATITNIVLTYVFSYFMTILVELPSLGLVKIFSSYMRGYQKKFNVANKDSSTSYEKNKFR